MKLRERIARRLLGTAYTVVGPGDDALSCGTGIDMADGGSEDTTDSADGDCELQIDIP